MHTSILCTWISQWFLAKKILLFKNNFKRIDHCKFIHHNSYLKPFLSCLPCIAHREYFSITFKVKKGALYSIKYDILLVWKWQTLACVNCHKKVFIAMGRLVVILTQRSVNVFKRFFLVTGTNKQRYYSLVSNCDIGKEQF